jgi:predicted PurR-regulated permease PerM
MLGRAGDLTARARERIRAAREHDPHAWPVGNEDSAALMHELEAEALADSHESADHIEPSHEGPDHDEHSEAIADGATAPPLGSPQPGAPDLDGPVSPGAVSGPPREGRPHRPGDRSRRLMTGAPASASVESSVPNGLRTAAAWSWRLIAVVVAGYVVLYVMAYIAVVVVPVIVALLLAALLQPGAAALVRKKWPRSMAAFAMLLVGLAVVAGIITLVIERFSAGFNDLATQVSAGIGKVQSFIVHTFPITKGELDAAVTRLQNSLVDNKGSLATGALSTALTVSEVVTGIFLTLFTLFFFLKDGRSIWLWLIGLLPRDSRAYMDEAGRRSWRTLISYVRATAIVALVDAIGIGLGLWILGVPLVIPLAALVFLGAFIPILGSFLAGSVAVLVALVTGGPVTALIALGVVVLVMQLEGHVMQPLLLGRAVRVHPLAVVLSIAAGLLIGGIFGALIAVPIVACANVAGTYLSRRNDGPRPPEPRPERARPAVGLS